ncbi:UNVERIFIED_CONTAM: hypothetical protein FKN15_001465 [Acipenser sinensis]
MALKNMSAFQKYCPGKTSTSVEKPIYPLIGRQGCICWLEPQGQMSPSRV